MSLFSSQTALAAIFTLILAAPIPSLAQRPVSFSPKQCSICPTMTNVPWEYQIGMNAAGTELPIDPNCAGSPTNPCPHYINWLDHTRYITGNSYIKQVGLNFTFFDTEPVNDTFSFGEVGGTPTTLSGSVAPGWHDVTVFGSLQTTPIATFFDSDDSLTRRGLKIDGARVCCSATKDPGVIDIEPHLRYTGILIGTGDVVYYRIPTTDEATHTTIALWGYPPLEGEQDPLSTVNVHVRCNALPTKIHSDYKGSRHSQQEFIHIPEGPSPPVCVGHWYIAAHSRGGAHTFNLVVARHLETQHRKLTAGFEHAIPPASDLPALATALSDGVKYYFGATEGTQYFDEIEIFTHATSCGDTDICDGRRCDICFYDETGRSSAGPCSPVIPIKMRKPSWTNIQTIAHEMAHKFFCLGDEYQMTSPTTSCSRCGHTIMANRKSTIHDICYLHRQNALENHNKDPSPGCQPSSGLPGWQVAFNKNRTPWMPSETPDNHTYLDFDFAGKVGNVVIY